jgi:hypothetical protein
MDSVSVEVVGLEELGPKLLFTKENIPFMDCFEKVTLPTMTRLMTKHKIIYILVGKKWIVKIS